MRRAVVMELSSSQAISRDPNGSPVYEFVQNLRPARVAAMIGYNLLRINFRVI
jgi:hypothetical protein